MKESNLEQICSFFVKARIFKLSPIYFDYLIVYVNFILGIDLV